MDMYTKYRQVYLRFIDNDGQVSYLKLRYFFKISLHL